jgi:Flp pilus assembly protein TadD
MDDSLFRFAGAVLLAEALVAQDRLEEALKVVVAVIDDLQLAHLDPVERLHMVHGDILGRLERYDEAETAFLAEIDSFPSNQLAYTNLAVVYYVQGKVDPARSTLERMVQANPHPISLLLAARTSRQLGDSEAAAVWQQRIDARP